MLERLRPNSRARRPRRRVGRGISSGHGRTCGRGQKGAGARSGSSSRAYYEGGQMPLARRLPKRGFHNPFRSVAQIVNLSELARLEAKQVVDAAALAEAGLIRDASRPVKILGNGDLSAALQLKVDAISAGARRKVEAAGGSVELIPARAKKGVATS